VSCAKLDRFHNSRTGYLQGGASAPRARILPGARPSGSSACGAEAPPHRSAGNAVAGGVAVFVAITAGVLMPGVCAIAQSAAPSGASSAPRRGPDVPFVASTNEAVAGILQLANVTRKDVVYDLGCGDGRIVIAAAKLRGARGVGIDIDPELVRKARESAAAAGVAKRVRFEENDLFEADIHDATVVVLFLAPELNVQLLPKLLKELKPGTRIVSNTFEMGDWKPDKEMTVGDPADTAHPFSHRLHLWTVPGRAGK